MSIKVGTNLDYSGKDHLDARQGIATTLADLLNWSDGNKIPQGFEVYVEEEALWFIYCPEYSNETTGHFKSRLEVQDESADSVLEEIREVEGKFLYEQSKFIQELTYGSEGSEGYIEHFQKIIDNSIIELENKVDKTFEGELLTDEDRQKLDSIEEGAQVNATKLPNPFELVFIDEESHSNYSYNGESSTNIPLIGRVQGVQGKIGDVVLKAVGSNQVGNHESLDFGEIDVISIEDNIVPLTDLNTKQEKQTIVGFSDMFKVLTEIDFSEISRIKLDKIEFAAQRNPTSLPNPHYLNLEVDGVISNYDGSEEVIIDFETTERLPELLQKENTPPTSITAGVAGQWLNLENIYTPSDVYILTASDNDEYSWGQVSWQLPNNSGTILKIELTTDGLVSEFQDTEILITLGEGFQSKVMYWKGGSIDLTYPNTIPLDNITANFPNKIGYRLVINRYYINDRFLVISASYIKQYTTLEVSVTSLRNIIDLKLQLSIIGVDTKYPINIDQLLSSELKFFVLNTSTYAKESVATAVILNSNLQGLTIDSGNILPIIGGKLSINLI